MCRKLGQTGLDDFIKQEWPISQSHLSSSNNDLTSGPPTCLPVLHHDHKYQQQQSCPPLISHHQPPLIDRHYSSPASYSEPIQQTQYHQGHQYPTTAFSGLSSDTHSIQQHSKATEQTSMPVYFAQERGNPPSYHPPVMPHMYHQQRSCPLPVDPPLPPSELQQYNSSPALYHELSLQHKNQPSHGLHVPSTLPFSSTHQAISGAQNRQHREPIYTQSSNPFFPAVPMSFPQQLSSSSPYYQQPAPTSDYSYRNVKGSGPSFQNIPHDQFYRETPHFVNNSNYMLPQSHQLSSTKQRAYPSHHQVYQSEGSPLHLDQAQYGRQHSSPNNEHVIKPVVSPASNVVQCTSQSPVCHHESLEKVPQSKIGISSTQPGQYQQPAHYQQSSHSTRPSNIQELFKETVTESTMPLVLKKDVTVQFNSLIAINDTLRGVCVGDKTMFTIQGDCPQSFNWDEYGLRIDAPQGTLSSTDTSDIAVIALVGGQFQLPEDTELVSIVYAISVSKPLQQRIKLKIQHCAHLVTENHASYLTFITASLDQPLLPYQFKLEEGGQFFPGDQYGSISLLQFSLKGIAKSVKRFVTRPFRQSRRQRRYITSSEETVTSSQSNYTDNVSCQITGSSSLTLKLSPTNDSQVISLIDDNPLVINSNSTRTSSVSLSTETNTNSVGISTRSVHQSAPHSTLTPLTSSKQSQTQDETPLNSSPPDNKYVGQVIYETKYQTSEDSEWLMRFMVAKYLNGLQEFIKTSLPSNIETDVHLPFTFIDSNGYIELILNEEDKHKTTGWSIRPHISPLLIYQSDVDMFGAQVPPLFPSILITISVEHGPNTAKKLDHGIPLRGIIPNNKKIIIVRSLSSNVTGSMMLPTGNLGQILDSSSSKEIFRTYYSDLCDLMCISPNRLCIAHKLYSARLITRECYDRAIDDSTKTDLEKGTSLMRGLRSSIDIDPWLLKTLIDVLKKSDAFRSVAGNMLQDLS